MSDGKWRPIIDAENKAQDAALQTQLEELEAKLRQGIEASFRLVAADAEMENRAVQGYLNKLAMQLEQLRKDVDELKRERP